MFHRCNSCHNHVGCCKHTASCARICNRSSFRHSPTECMLMLSVDWWKHTSLSKFRNRGDVNNRIETPNGISSVKILVCLRKYMFIVCLNFNVEILQCLLILESSKRLGIVLSVSRGMRKYFKVGHDRFIPCPFQLNIQALFVFFV
jgi:hypothetical protein